MRILIIRHGDPDYEHDSLTPKGWKEAEYLSERISKMDIAAFYVSPLGRAKATASLTLKKMNRTATECPWLREFAPTIQRPDVTDRRMISWDWLPQDWTKEEEFYRRDLWYTQENMKEGKVKEEYDWVTSSFDQLLAKHGYVRHGENYHVDTQENMKEGKVKEEYDWVRSGMCTFKPFNECITYGSVASHLCCTNLRYHNPHRGTTRGNRYLSCCKLR